ncbi:MAG: dihydrolipoyl dehydrogenase [SAR324 cluster bacterium]|nr:dihydrolipoyl dehydrogenase [SAR324 cluster bacterium]
MSVGDIEVDVVVIGAGPAGYVAALALSQGGKSVALIDKRKSLGGTCLNEGCIPSKAVLESSKHFYNLQNKYSLHGIEATGTLDFAKLMERKDTVVKTNAKGLDFLMKKYKVEVITGQASFVDSTSILVAAETNQTITFSQAIIATGSAPTEIPDFAFDGNKILSSKELLELDSIPKKLLVLGAGVIGLELGSFLNRIGSEVEIIELKDRLLPEMDEDISKDILRCLKKQKMKFHFKSKAHGCKITDAGVEVNIGNDKGQEKTLLGDKLLVCVGRKPVTEGLGLEKVGITTDQWGFVPVKENYQTNNSNIYAIGDVTQGMMLAHKASDDATQVAEILLGKQKTRIKKQVPSVIYTSPEASAVGQTEQELIAAATEFTKGVFPLRPLGRALAAGEQDGFAKILSDPKTKGILGVHLVGERATDLISEATLAMENNLSLDDLIKVIYPHPSYAESLKEAALVSVGHSHHL